jgi:acetyl-CoA carboxylase biotin carboxyl carrier protein
MLTNNIKYKIKSLYCTMKNEKIYELTLKTKDFNIYIKRKENKIEKKIFFENKQLENYINKINVEKNILYKQPNVIQKKIQLEKIKSYIPGMFYRSPSPNLPPFVKEGDIVEVGKTLCILEAMKVMNEIKNMFKCKIIKIYVENGSLVSIDQDLFEVEKI